METAWKPEWEAAYRAAREELLGERTGCYWVGHLASSALATATAVSTLSIWNQHLGPASAGQFGKDRIDPLIRRGVQWICNGQNSDGGWGDTAESFSNISTSMLVRAALTISESTREHRELIERCDRYIEGTGGVEAVFRRYGKDRTFAVPILINCALAGQADWKQIPMLPFEAACFPHAWFRFLRLHVVSYALPALIAIGQLIHEKRPTRNLLLRWIRNAARAGSLRKLDSIQPESGGFLEATPLTSFVTMSLLALGKRDHPVARRGMRFIVESARDDGSWPIDTNLSVWVTTLAVNGLARAGSDTAELPGLDDPEATRGWLLQQQQKQIHPYTNAEPGGWGWSHLSGSVPDADDSPGALLALSNLPLCESSYDAARLGIRWLLNLQNRNGGWPTFCRGWTNLPFDRSGPDLTAHVMRAFARWRGLLKSARDGRLVSDITISLAKGYAYLCREQKNDGSWIPLWFGNQQATGELNPTYGTSRVLVGLHEAGWGDSAAAERAACWLLGAQEAKGGWSGAPGGRVSVEETALALEALAFRAQDGKTREMMIRGAAYLVDQVGNGNWRNPSPIGFYFAKLWYFEKLYPQVYTVAALGKIRQILHPPNAQPQ